MAFPAELFTARLRLRPPAGSDAAAVFRRYAHDPQVTRYLSWTPHRSIEETAEYLQRRARENAAGACAGYLIYARENGVLLGAVGGQIQGHFIQFGYCLARDAWGRGIATEAARVFVEAAIAQPPIWRVQAFCDVDNRASARVLEKSGLALEGTLRRYMVMPNLGDEPRDMLCYAKVREPRAES
jgi:RimJ/RimL family protein N-acetyltransferase